MQSRDQGVIIISVLLGEHPLLQHAPFEIALEHYIMNSIENYEKSLYEYLNGVFTLQWKPVVHKRINESFFLEMSMNSRVWIMLSSIPSITFEI